MANRSPTTGSHVSNASHAPHRAILSRCFSNVSRFTRNHFSIHSHFPNHPIPKDVRPPSQLPTVADTKQPTGSQPAISIAHNNASELNGTTVAARKEPKNRPHTPYC